MKINKTHFIVKVDEIQKQLLLSSFWLHRLIINKLFYQFMLVDAFFKLISLR